MKKNIILIIGVTIGIVVILFLGSVVEIGDKIGHIGTPVAEYIFYGIIGALLLAFVLIPIFKVWAAPDMPALTTEDVEDPEILTDLGHKLVNSCSYIKDEEERKIHHDELAKMLKESANDAESLRSILDNELQLRFKGDKEQGVIGVDRRIHEWARTVFLVTAISQNSKFDSLSVIALNYKMIEDIILSSGFRPTRPQMFRIYGRVLATSLISLVASDAIGEFGMELDLSGAAGEFADAGGGKLLDTVRRLHIPEFVLGSALDGALNALLTLRIGYVTKSCLTKGAKALSDKKTRKMVKRSAIKSAYASLPGIITSSAGVLGKGVTGRLTEFFARRAEAAEA